MSPSLCVPDIMGAMLLWELLLLGWILQCRWGTGWRSCSLFSWCVYKTLQHSLCNFNHSDGCWSTVLPPPSPSQRKQSSPSPWWEPAFPRLSPGTQWTAPAMVAISLSSCSSFWLAFLMKHANDLPARGSSCYRGHGWGLRSGHSSLRPTVIIIHFHDLHGCCTGYLPSNCKDKRKII